MYTTWKCAVFQKTAYLVNKRTYICTYLHLHLQVTCWGGLKGGAEDKVFTGRRTGWPCTIWTVLTWAVFNIDYWKSGMLCLWQHYAKIILKRRKIIKWKGCCVLPQGISSTPSKLPFSIPFMLLIIFDFNNNELIINCSTLPCFMCLSIYSPIQRQWKCLSAWVWFIVSITYCSHTSEKHGLFLEIALKRACDDG